MNTMERAPGLGGTDAQGLTGREPVLKGVNSRIVADRRGAYLTGSLKSLRKLMTNAQQHSFKDWNIKLLLRRVEAVLPIFEKEYYYNDRPRQAMRMTELWLENPTAIPQGELITAYSELKMASFEVRGHAAFVAHAAAVALSMTIVDWNLVHLITREGIWQAARAHGFADNRNLTVANDIVHDAVKRAQVRAAYIILNRAAVDNSSSVSVSTLFE